MVGMLKTALIVSFVFHEALALIHYDGQAPLLSSTSYSLLEASDASIFSSGAVPSETFRAVQDSQPTNIEDLNIKAAPQQPTGQISESPQRGEGPTNTEHSHDGTTYPSPHLVDASRTPWSVSFLLEEMAVKKRALIAAISSLLGYLTLNELYHRFNSTGQEDALWIATSDSWFDRKTCQWIGVCGANHIHNPARLGDHTQRKVQRPLQQEEEWRSAWTKGKSRPEHWSNHERVLREIPKYVLDYAPLVHLYSGEQFWPCDAAEHLIHTTPHLNYTPLQARSEHPNLTNLNELNKWNRGRFIYLKSDDDVEDRPGWLGGEKNIPESPSGSGIKNEKAGSGEWLDVYPHEEPTDANIDWSEVGKGSFREQGGERHNPGRVHNRAVETQLQTRTKSGRSDAPAVLVVVDKGHGVVDAFWFYFYSFNLGNVVLNVRFGNHVGDWEHSMVRFHHGKPKAIFLSEHNFGEAYTYEAVEKRGKRVSHGRLMPSHHSVANPSASSLSSTPPPVRMPCTRRPVGTHTCYR